MNTIPIESAKPLQTNGFSISPPLPLHKPDIEVKLPQVELSNFHCNIMNFPEF